MSAMIIHALVFADSRTLFSTVFLEFVGATYVDTGLVMTATSQQLCNYHAFLLNLAGSINLPFLQLMAMRRHKTPAGVRNLQKCGILLPTPDRFGTAWVMQHSQVTFSWYLPSSPSNLGGKDKETKKDFYIVQSI